MTETRHFYEVRPRKDKRGADVISDVLPFGVIETHEQAGESSTYATFGSTLTITGERNVQ